MSAQRATISDDDRREGEEAIARIRRIQARIAANNPDMTEDDWERLAEAWAEDVNEGLRRHVIKQREEAGQRTS